MGMYLTAYKKGAEGKFEKDYRWDDSKWTGRGEFFEMLLKDALCEKDLLDDGTPYNHYPAYYRPKNVDALRQLFDTSENREHQAFKDLLDLMEKDESVYVQYD